VRIAVEWRVGRALAALQSGEPVDFAIYAEVFGMDEEDTIGIFQDAAGYLGMCLTVVSEPVLH
jgi:hypothetical protein